MLFAVLTEQEDASHQWCPGLIPGIGVICGMNLLLVLVLALCSERFLRVLPLSSKTNIPTFRNSNSIWI